MASPWHPVLEVPRGDSAFIRPRTPWSPDELELLRGWVAAAFPELPDTLTVEPDGLRVRAPEGLPHYSLAEITAERVGEIVGRPLGKAGAEIEAEPADMIEHAVNHLAAAIRDASTLGEPGVEATHLIAQLIFRVDQLAMLLGYSGVPLSLALALRVQKAADAIAGPGDGPKDAPNGREPPP